MALIIPLQAVESQSLAVTLAGQPCTIDVYQKTAPLAVYVDLYVSNVLVIGGVIARNAGRIVRSKYLGFVGDLAFFDMQQPDPIDPQDDTPSDPYWTGLGVRYLLTYLTPDDLGGAG
jgi:hypothetical protein